MTFRRGLILFACGVLAGCGTLDRAADARRELASYGAPTAPSNTALRALQTAAAARPLLLPDFVNFAMTNRPDMIQARLAVTDAVLALAQVTADGLLVPKLSGAGGFTRATDNAGRHFSMHGSSRYSASVTLDLLIYDFGRADALEAQARETLAAADRQRAQTELTVFRETSEAYFGLLKADALLEAAYTNEFLYAQHYEEAKALFDVQEAKKLDVLKAAMDLQDAKLNTANCSNAVRTAEASFGRALGVPADGAFRARVLPRAKAPLAGARLEIEKSGGDLTAHLAQAYENAPSAAYAAAQYRAANAYLDYAVADLFPELSADATFAYAEPVWNFTWGWKLAQSLFEGYKKTAAVDRAVIALQQAAEDVRAAQKELAADVASAEAALADARANLAAARVKADQAKENLGNVREEYRVGAASRLDYTEAVKTFSQAMGNRVAGIYAVQSAEAKLASVCGDIPAFTDAYVAADGTRTVPKAAAVRAPAPKKTATSNETSATKGTPKK